MIFVQPMVAIQLFIIKTKNLTIKTVVIIVITLDKLEVMTIMYIEFYEKVDGLAKAIGVTTSTAKKYYLLFEEQGYNFKRNQQGQLLFSQDDIDLFKELIVLKNEKGKQKWWKRLIP